MLEAEVIYSSHLFGNGEKILSFIVLPISLVLSEIGLPVIYVILQNGKVYYIILKLHIFFQTLHFRWKTCSEWVRLGERAILCCSG